MAKTSLRSKFNRWMFRNRDRGIPNLMLYLAIGNGVVYLLTLLNQANPFFYELLYFNPERILAGQVWRLFTYPLVYLCEASPLFGVISLLFYYWCGKVLDQYWGSLRFNLYYLSAVLLTDLAGVGISLILSSSMGVLGTVFSMAMGIGFAGYINMSLFLAVATLLPDQQIRIYFVIPVKMKWLAWLDLGLTLLQLIRGVFSLLFLAKGFFFSYLLCVLTISGSEVGHPFFMRLLTETVLPLPTLLYVGTVWSEDTRRGSSHLVLLLICVIVCFFSVFLASILF